MAKWTDLDRVILKMRVAQGVTDIEIGRELGRSAASVEWRRGCEGLTSPHFHEVRRSWTQEDEDTLRQLASEGVSITESAQALGRSYRAVAMKRHTLGLTPGQTREPRALPPGLPSWEELSDAIARWGVDGAAEEYDVSEAEVLQWRELLAGGK